MIILAASISSTMKKFLHSTTISSPLGSMLAIADDNHLYYLGFCDSKKVDNTLEKIRHETKSDITEGSTKIHSELKAELEKYFEGKLRKFSVPLSPIGTEFQKQVWEQIANLEFGVTRSYGELAAMTGRDARHSRSVGNATGANPIVILVPCHRVKAHNDKLGGFSCGINRKIWLLKHENCY